MKILIGCERSGVVRRAFTEKGHNVVSCDLQASEDSSNRHIQCDVLDLLWSENWDMLIAFPPCRFLSYAGARWWRRSGWADQQQKALLLFQLLLDAPVEKICVENPRGLASKLIRKPDDHLDPCEFGERYTKKTYLWLKNLPPLMRTFLQTSEGSWTQKARGFDRARTFEGVARAMAEQYV